MSQNETPSPPESLLTALGPGEGQLAWRQVPIQSGGQTYWRAAARVNFLNGKIVDVAIALQGPEGVARRLSVVESRLLRGNLHGADGVLDAVSSLVECEDDEYGSAAAKSYLAGWVCADIVGRCLAAGKV